jgi:spore coat polysaccharide biosynthesis protein SpsF
MKVGLIVICRYNSSRLPGKILKPLAEKPLLTHILERLSISRYAEHIIVATSNEATDDPIAAYCQKHKIPMYRGSLNNVSQRFASCMAAYGLDFAVRVNGDNIFTDPRLIDQAVELTIQEDYDFVSNVKGRTYPTGMSVEVVKAPFYQNAINLFTEEEYKEHVTLYFYKHETLGNFHFITNTEIEEAKGMNLAVDTVEDFRKAEKILSKMDRPFKNYSWEEIVQITQDVERE